jgi:hypothetical protein
LLLPSARSAATAVAITAGLVVLCAICCHLAVPCGRPMPNRDDWRGQRRRLHPMTPHGVDFSAGATARRERRVRKPSKSGEIDAIPMPVSRGREAKAMQPAGPKAYCFEGHTLDLRRGCLRKADRAGLDRFKPKEFDRYLGEPSCSRAQLNASPRDRFGRTD